MDLRCTERDQACHFSCLVVGVEIQMEARWQGGA
jgi:hypothetical protein